MKLPISTLAASLSILAITTALPSVSEPKALEARQGGYNTGIWIFTFYGWPDSYSPSIDCTSAANHNPPQGSNTIAYPGCAHLGGTRGAHAGGDGSYENPLTAAAYPGSVPVPKCGVFYSPYLQKFLIFEDYCPSCQGSTPHWDIWTGGGKSDSNLRGVCACEETLTPPSNKACAFWHFNGNAVSDLDKGVNKGNLWGGGSCHPEVLNRYWQQQSGLSNRCGPH